MFGCFYKFHLYMLEKHTSIKDINILQQSHLFTSKHKNINLKSFYQLTYYCFCNVLEYIFTDSQEFIKGKKFVENVKNNNNVIHIENKLKGIKSVSEYEKILKSHPMLNEVITNTYIMLEKYDNKNDIASALTQFIAGNCWFNAKKSYGYKICDCEQSIIDNINKGVELVDPIKSELYLFHGFEKYVLYDIDNGIVNVKGFTAKSLSFTISERFAIGTNYLRPQFLIVKYPKDSKHLKMSIRPFDEEFEFLTHSNESFKIQEIYKYFNGIQLYTFYFCVPVE